MNKESKRDHYEVLGLDKNASTEDIKKRYYYLAGKYHPNVSKEPDAKEKMKEINNAYHVLSDPERKKMYDSYGHDAENINFHNNNAQGFDFNKEGFNFSGFGDIFGSIFDDFTDTFQSWNFGFQDLNRKGRDIHYRVLVKKEDWILQKKFQLNIVLPYPDFLGKTEGVYKCNDCDGKGSKTVKTFISGFFGNNQKMVFNRQEDCQKCNTWGRLIKENHLIKINKNEKVIKISEKGGFSESKKGKRGDLYLELSIQ
jgi:molecular chaperone DnaJ